MFYGETYIMVVKNSGISQYVKNVALECSAFTHVELKTEWNYQNVISPFNRIYIPTSGQGKVYSNGKEYIVKKGRVTIIPAMTEFSCECENSLDKFYAHVNVLGRDGLDLFSFANEVIELEEDYSDELIALYKQKDVLCAVKIKMLLFEILFNALSKKNYQYPEAKPYSNAVYNALNYINNNLSSNLKISEVAKNLSISSITLQKKWREEINVPIGKYIDDKIMFLAERELSNGNLNVGEIAEKFGFCDRFYFSRKFKEYFGLSPKKYSMKGKM